MAYTRELAINFWFEFDDFFAGHPNPQVIDALRRIRFSSLQQIWTSHRVAGTYPDGYRQNFEAVKSNISFLADEQLRIIDQLFAGDRDMERQAFVDFGQGVLFDDRRVEGDKVHKMDISVDKSGQYIPPIGYHRWHAFIRAAVLLGADAQRWLEIDRYVGLAWAIQSEARPQEDKSDNPGLPAHRIAELEARWLVLTADELDSEFDSYPEPFTSFARDISPLFRPKDVLHMKFVFDLSSYDDVSSHAKAILARLEDGSMPTDGRWAAYKINLFARWIEQGMRP